MFYNYKNLHGNSSVTAYEIHDTSIRICFKGNIVYDYSASIIGISKLNMMKHLAEQGFGLGSFINHSPTIRQGYSYKGRRL